MSSIKQNRPRGERITLAQALDYFPNLVDRNTDASSPTFFLDENLILRLLAPTRCTGIKIHLSHDNFSGYKVMLVGVDQNGNTLLPMETEDLGLDEDHTIVMVGAVDLPQGNLD